MPILVRVPQTPRQLNRLAREEGESHSWVALDRRNIHGR
jgi:hypothetical protein